MGSCSIISHSLAHLHPLNINYTNIPFHPPRGKNEKWLRIWRLRKFNQEIFKHDPRKKETWASYKWRYYIMSHIKFSRGCSKTSTQEIHPSNYPIMWFFSTGMCEWQNFTQLESWGEKGESALRESTWKSCGKRFHHVQYSLAFFLQPRVLLWKITKLRGFRGVFHKGVWQKKNFQQYWDTWKAIDARLSSKYR